jgi:hypothetical protein
VYTVRIPMSGASVSITNMLWVLQTAGGTLTAGQNFAGLYDNAGTLIGATADQTASGFVGGQTQRTVALSGGPFSTSSPVLYAAFVFNGTTGPGFQRCYAGPGAPGVINQNATGANLPCGTILTGQTTLPGTITLSSLSGSTSTPQFVWVGLS